MSDSVEKSLTDHFTRAWDMILEAAGRFPESQWCQAGQKRMQPARVVYHILMGADRYTWPDDPKQFPTNRKFQLDWENAPAEEFLGQKEAIRQLEVAKTRTLDWLGQLGDAKLVAEGPTWPWTGRSFLGQALYHLRHLQHHMAELNAELAQCGLAIVDWK